MKAVLTPGEFFFVNSNKDALGFTKISRTKTDNGVPMSAPISEAEWNKASTNFPVIELETDTQLKDLYDKVLGAAEVNFDRA